MLDRTRRAARRGPVVVVATIVVAWLLLGTGYHRLESACYDSRHAGSAEGEVYGGPIGAVFEVALWPLFLAGDAVSGSDCTPPG